MGLPQFFVIGGTLGTIVAVVSFIGMILALISLFRRTDAEVVGNSRMLWALVVLLLPFAWIVYFGVGLVNFDRQ